MASALDVIMVQKTNMPIYPGNVFVQLAMGIVDCREWQRQGVCVLGMRHAHMLQICPQGLTHTRGPAGSQGSDGR